VDLTSLLFLFLDFFTKEPLNISCHVGENLFLHMPDVLKKYSSISLRRNNTESKYVAFCRDHHPISPEEQNLKFEKRVEATPCNETSGNWSLTLLYLTKNDTGAYIIKGKGKGNSFELPIILSVTAAADVSPTQRPTVDPEPEAPGRIGLYVSLGLTAAAAAALMVKLLLNCYFKASNSDSVV
ncbi:hypothetical protein GOODEAATRI_032469, partial [Goodea atripinnis]